MTFKTNSKANKQVKSEKGIRIGKKGIRIGKKGIRIGKKVSGSAKKVSGSAKKVSGSAKNPVNPAIFAIYDHNCRNLLDPSPIITLIV